MINWHLAWQTLPRTEKTAKVLLPVNLLVSGLFRREKSLHSCWKKKKSEQKNMCWPWPKQDRIVSGGGGGGFSSWCSSRSSLTQIEKAPSLQWVALNNITHRHCLSTLKGAWEEAAGQLLFGQWCYAMLYCSSFCLSFFCISFDIIFLSLVKLYSHTSRWSDAANTTLPATSLPATTRNTISAQWERKKERILVKWCPFLLEDATTACLHISRISNLEGRIRSTDESTLSIWSKGALL